MIPRQLEATVNRLAKGLPVITITGPRQSGKTTLAREMFSDHEYVSLENPDNQQLATVDPHAFLNLHSGPTIFDEAQRIPTLFSYLQETVDRTNAPGQYVLTVSQNFLLIKSIFQTLAERVGVAYLLPLSYRELLNANLRPASIEDFIVKGGYPRLYSSELIASDFYASYLRTYVERDVRDELGVRKIADFRKYLTLCATRIGNIFSNRASSPSDCSRITSATAKGLSKRRRSIFMTPVWQVICSTSGAASSYCAMASYVDACSRTWWSRKSSSITTRGETNLSSIIGVTVTARRSI